MPGDPGDHLCPVERPAALSSPQPQNIHSVTRGPQPNSALVIQSRHHDALACILGLAPCPLMSDLVKTAAPAVRLCRSRMSQPYQITIGVHVEMGQRGDAAPRRGNL